MTFSVKGNHTTWLLTGWKKKEGKWKQNKPKFS
jgi:hypothetical protein